MSSRQRKLIRAVVLAAPLLVASLAPAASTRGVRPKAKATHPPLAHSATAVPPGAQARPHPGRSSHASSGRYRGAQRRGGYGVSGNPYRSTASGPMVASLRSVVAKLHQADHDYDGHRVQAIKQLNQAIGSMTPGPGNGGNVGGPHVRTASQGRGTGPRMSQAQSDAHLRQAHQQLIALERQFGGMGTQAKHHQQAHNHVRSAIGHLNTALGVR